MLIVLFLGFGLGVWWTSNAIKPKLANYYELSEKHFEIMNIFKIWFEYYEQGNRLEDYFKKNNYKKIAIYGVGFLGERLLCQLKKTNIEIEYILDRKQGYVYGDIPVLTLDDKLGWVDVVVITSTYYYWAISREIERKQPRLKVISIEEIFKSYT